MQLNSEGYPIELSLVGPEYYLSRKRLNRVLSTKKFSNRIKILGKINYEDLDIIYSQMDACIYASSCETFGMTLLEAMASSMPIACSNRSSMPELLKDSGIYFNPEKIEELKKSILTLMLDEQLRKYLGQKAHNYAKDYKWETTSKETFSYLYNIACRDVG
jgi:glycosyltransferase involved in cell wall biosynthesis